MKGYIDNFNFSEMPPQKYWAPPKTWDTNKKQTEVKNRIFSGDWIAAEKMDGYFAKLVKDEDGNILLHSRSKNVNGVYPEKHEWVPHLNEFFNSLPNGTCVLGELYLPSKPGSSNITSLLGCLKDKCIARQEKGEKLHFYAFDVLAWNGENLISKPIIERIQRLSKIFQSRFVRVAKYYSGEALWNKLGEILAAGGEGMVLVRRGAPYQPDKRPSKDCMKVKKEIQQTIDCVVIGANPPTKEYSGKSIETWKYYINIRTDEKLPIGEHYKEYYNGEPIMPVTRNWYEDMAGSLKIGLVNENTIYYFGDISGLSHDILKNWKDYKGKVCEVSAMEITDDLKLRHPKFIQWRPDKTIKDCSIDQIK